MPRGTLRGFDSRRLQNEYVAQRIFARLREAGMKVDLTRGRPTAECVGAGFAGAEKAREAKAKTEAARRAAFEAVGALETSGEYLSAATMDAAMAKIVKAMDADAEAGAKLADAIEAGREDALMEWGAERAEAVERAKVLLDKLIAELVGIATCERVMGATRSNNPEDRYGEIPDVTRGLAGGQALAAAHAQSGEAC